MQDKKGATSATFACIIKSKLQFTNRMQNISQTGP